MPGLIVDCPEHGPQQSPNFFEGLGTVVMSGTTMSCPRCGRVSPVIDGSYRQGAGGHLSADLSPTPAQAARLQAVLKWAQVQIETAATDEAAVAATLEREIAETAPALAKALAAFRSPTSANLAAWVAVLLAVLMWWTSGDNGGVTEDQIEHIVREVVQSENPAPPATPSGPDPSATDGAR